VSAFFGEWLPLNHCAVGRAEVFQRNAARALKPTAQFKSSIRLDETQFNGASGFRTYFKDEAS